MLSDLRGWYETELQQLAGQMRQGFEVWPTQVADTMRDLVERQIGRRGQKLRPLFAIIVADLLQVPREKVVPLAAAVELYHCASLVLDDVQDNSDFRRGDAAIHVAASVSNAINLAGVVRSFSYYPIHAAASLSTVQKLAVLREIDVMATAVPLGQSMEIGWHQGWFGDDVTQFPYHEMARLKTGAPFACAAAGAAALVGGDPSRTQRLRELGFEVGRLYQLVDDYGELHECGDQLPDDVRDGKPTRLVQVLAEQADPATRDRLRRDVKDAGADRSWMLEALRDVRVTRSVENEIRRVAAASIAGFGSVSSVDGALTRLDAFISGYLAPTRA